MRFSVPDDNNAIPANKGPGGVRGSTATKREASKSPGEGHGSHMAGGGGRSGSAGLSISPTGKTLGPAGKTPAGDLSPVKCPTVKSYIGQSARDQSNPKRVS
jgi:hypothetical protein